MVVLSFHQVLRPSILLPCVPNHWFYPYQFLWHGKINSENARAGGGGKITKVLGKNNSLFDNFLCIILCYFFKLKYIVLTLNSVITAQLLDHSTSSQCNLGIGKSLWKWISFYCIYDFRIVSLITGWVDLRELSK